MSVLATTWILWHLSLVITCTPDGYCPAPTVLELVAPSLAASWHEQSRHASQAACTQAWRRLEDIYYQRQIEALTREAICRPV